jgi:magnesium chelatase family protein
MGRENEKGESHLARKRVENARLIQNKRYGNETSTNSDMTVRDIEKKAHMEESAETLLTHAAKVHKLSPRSYHRTIKLARTIADLDASEHIQEKHILEALTYRPKDLFE